MSKPLELIPNQKEKMKPFFESEEAYQKFRRSFAEEMKPALERFREARHQSEEKARHHWVK